MIEFLIIILAGAVLIMLVLIVILIGIILAAFLFGSTYCLVVGAKRHTNQEIDDQAQMEWLKNLNSKKKEK